MFELRIWKWFYIALLLELIGWLPVEFYTQNYFPFGLGRLIPWSSRIHCCSVLWLMLVWLLFLSTEDFRLFCWFLGVWNVTRMSPDVCLFSFLPLSNHWNHSVSRHIFQLCDNFPIISLTGFYSTFSIFLFLLYLLVRY